MNHIFAISIATLLAVCDHVSGFGGGAPASACETMKPGPPHHPNQLTDSEKKSVPFRLVARPKDNGQVKVFLRTTTDQQKFRGFMIMAEIDGERGHGYFYPAKASLKMANPVDCKNLPESCQDESCQGKANAMSHSSNDDKESITLIWTPPSSFNGKVEFVATVVGQNSDSVSTWWENVRSNDVKI